MRTRLTALACVVLLGAGTAPALARPTSAPQAPHPSAPSAPAATSARVASITAIHLSGLAAGAPPRIASIRGTHLDFGVGDYTLRRPDGTTLPLPRGTWSEWAPMGQGAIGTFGTEAEPEIQVVDRSGGVTSSMEPHYGLAVSPDRSIVGWLKGRLNTPHVVEGGGSRTFDLPRIGHGLSIGTIAGAGTCKEQSPEGGGCTVFVNTAGDRGVWVSTSHGIVDRVGPMRSVTDVDAHGRVIGRAADVGSRPCSAMWKPNLRPNWTTCDARLVAFAPGGHRVLGVGPTGEKFGDVHRIAMYDDSGLLLASYTARGRDHVTQVAWEDRSHVLATVFEEASTSACPGPCHGQWAVVRLSVDGAVRLATPTVRGRIDYRAWSLPLT